VRKLLVAGPWDGAGKTTAAVHLAAAAAEAGARALLLDADPAGGAAALLDLPRTARRRPLAPDQAGAFYPDVVPGLDVLAPCEGGGPCEAAAALLRLLGASAGPSHHDCLIVDAPPGLGDDPGRLLAACDEVLLVLRAGPSACRTLPALLERVPPAGAGGPAGGVRGVLLTLPAGRRQGGRRERELREQFGDLILPQVIPHDPDVARARKRGQVVFGWRTESPAAAQYRALAEALGLAAPRGAPAAAAAGPPADGPHAGPAGPHPLPTPAPAGPEEPGATVCEKAEPPAVPAALAEAESPGWLAGAARPSAALGRAAAGRRPAARGAAALLVCAGGAAGGAAGAWLLNLPHLATPALTGLAVAGFMAPTLYLLTGPRAARSRPGEPGAANTASAIMPGRAAPADRPGPAN
jgi:cellulose biosynthesis protein BcsQ